MNCPSYPYLSLFFLLLLFSFLPLPLRKASVFPTCDENIILSVASERGSLLIQKLIISPTNIFRLLEILGFLKFKLADFCFFPKIRFDRATFNHATTICFQTLSGSNDPAVHQETSSLTARGIQNSSVSDILHKSNRDFPCEMRSDNGMTASKVNGRPKSLSEQLSSYWITPPESLPSPQQFPSQSTTPDLLNFYTKSQVPKTVSSKTTAITSEGDTENGVEEQDKDTTGEEVSSLTERVSIVRFTDKDILSFSTQTLNIL